MSGSEYNKKFDTEGFANGGLQLYSYRYDQLNRLTGQDAHVGFDTALNRWNGMTDMGDFMTERILSQKQIFEQKKSEVV